MTELFVTVDSCMDDEPHTEHFYCCDEAIFWCRGQLPQSFPLCQVAHPEVREALPCKYAESGGYQCERLDLPHTAHSFGDHTIMHSLAGNGYHCDSFT